MDLFLRFGLRWLSPRSFSSLDVVLHVEGHTNPLLKLCVWLMWVDVKATSRISYFMCELLTYQSVHIHKEVIEVIGSNPHYFMDES